MTGQRSKGKTRNEGEMTVREAGRKGGEKGGQRVRELVEQGKETERRGRR